MNSRHSSWLLVFIIVGVIAGLLVGWFLDRFRTATNVWGDAVGAAVVHRFLQHKFRPPAH